ncbi:hypothetical protein O6H91_07G033800 [Diphasiastrum complanatum]|uniref:Uncharacterized protein n=1 Tax=Diphasiastrum complanatum TaxID=34168 RepID=A0ACC2D3R0_DIPCM|nr:hypothetical protein O6H91_07G033800 [Diphasiastrum complanatum]
MASNWDSLTSVDGKEELLSHLQRMADFLKQHEVLWRAHLVSFFQERLWEKMDKEWSKSLEHVAVQELLKLPLGITHDGWPSSLREFASIARSLSLFRKPKSSNHMVSKPPPINHVLAQGMNSKKLHEVEILGAVVAHFAEKVKATDVIDVGAGQGYLAQVLSFQYELPVIAIDCCSHHMDVTKKRAAQIQKHYKARVQKDQWGQSAFPGPRTLTYHFGAVETPTLLPLLNSILLSESAAASNKPRNISVLDDGNPLQDKSTCLDATNCFGSSQPSGKHGDIRSVVVAGLHACGDLSANMLRNFLDCDEVNAVVCVGCCYNLLSEGHNCGFPLSEGVKNAGLLLDRSGRDLACQSAERWSSMRPEAAAQNFQVHTFRAAFQLVLQRYYPKVAAANPCVGRLGKARRRKQTCKGLPLTTSGSKLPEISLQVEHLQLDIESATTDQSNPDKSVESFGQRDTTEKVIGCITEIDPISQSRQSYLEKDYIKESLLGFQEYAKTALKRLRLPEVPEKELVSIWEEIEPYMALVGVFWSLRAVLAPVLESYILLDRLLFLKEQALKANNEDRETIISQLVPLFDPLVSPRNMAIVAMRCA